MSAGETPVCISHYTKNISPQSNTSLYFIVGNIYLFFLVIHTTEQQAHKQIIKILIANQSQHDRIAKNVPVAGSKWIKIKCTH
jgi:hypothetical protein